FGFDSRPYRWPHFVRHCIGIGAVVRVFRRHQPPGAVRAQSRLARRLRSDSGHGGNDAAKSARHVDRRQDARADVPRTVPGPRAHGEGRAGLSLRPGSVEPGCLTCEDVSSKVRKPADLPLQAPTRFELGDQPQDCQGDRLTHSAAARRQGDRMRSSMCGRTLKGIESGDSRVTQRGRGMVVHRRELLRLAGATAAVAGWPQAAWADTYPSRPVRILVGYAAGGGVDIAARLIGQWLSERLQQQFAVENRTGAATNIATEAAVRSPQDGYTLLLVNAANAINATYYENLSFNFMRDIAPVTGIGRFPYFMAVNPAFPAKNVSEFIAYAKANPRRVNMGTGGAGGPDHVSGELLQLMTGIQMTHVPYRGTAPALNDLLGGQVQMVFCTIPSAIQYVKAGTLRAIAVTSASRLESMPEIPTVGDTVPGF